MIIIELPWPDKDLSPNARVHWSHKRVSWVQAKQFVRVALRLYADSVLPLKLDVPPNVDHQLELEFCYPTKGKRDLDNLLASCKAYIDGIAEWFTMDDAHFQPIIVRRGPIVKGGKVIVGIGA